MRLPNLRGSCRTRLRDSVDAHHGAMNQVLIVSTSNEWRLAGLTRRPQKHTLHTSHSIAAFSLRLQVARRRQLANLQADNHRRDNIVGALFSGDRLRTAWGRFLLGAVRRSALPVLTHRSALRNANAT